MVNPAGSKIPETIVGEFHCNTKAAGWLNGAHPTGNSYIDYFQVGQSKLDLPLGSFKYYVDLI